MIEIYTDGACSGNPGPGGYGVIVLKDNELIFVLSQRTEYTTNNKEELKALNEAINYALKNIKHKFTIYCDSAYCVNMALDWIYTWANNNWMNSKKQQVENIELVKELYKKLTLTFPNYTIEKIKGHNNIVGNELADAAATNNWLKFKEILEKNDIKYENLKIQEIFDIIK